MIITNLSEARANLSRLIERVQRGEEIVIGKVGAGSSARTARRK